MISLPSKVELNETEKKLFESIQNSFPNVREAIFDGTEMESLFRSLYDRKAIPEIRLKIFEKPEFAETGKKSILQIFNSNGTNTKDVIRHSHFFKYLEYFIQGPSLPSEVMKEFVKISNQNSYGGTPDLTDDILKLVRSCIRNYKLDKNKAKTDFFRLALESSYSIEDSKTIRKTAMSV